jgi:hypothetical protein
MRCPGAASVRLWFPWQRSERVPPGVATRHQPVAAGELDHASDLPVRTDDPHLGGVRERRDPLPGVQDHLEGGRVDEITVRQVKHGVRAVEPDRTGELALQIWSRGYPAVRIALQDRCRMIRRSRGRRC